MRLAFMGTPDFALPTLLALHAVGHSILAVYTQPPRPAGRGKALQPSPVQIQAEQLGLPVRSPVSLRDAEAQAAFAALNLDAAVVAAYGLILPRPILDAPRHGCLNVHGSLLPRWRGAAPVQRAILAGDAVTGATIMQMEAGLDTGPMRAKAETPVDGKTAGALTREISVLGAALMIELLDDLAAFPPEPQPEAGVTHAPKIDKAEARLDFAADAIQVERQVRAFNPWPGAFFELDGERYRVHAAELIDGRGNPGITLDDRLAIACGTGAIRPSLIQRAGKPSMPLDDLLRGRPVPAGTRLA